MRVSTMAAMIAATMLILFSPPAGARGHHGFGGSGHAGMHPERGTHGGGMHGSGAFANDQRRADDDYVKAASDEQDRLLNSKIKSICRGC